MNVDKFGQQVEALRSRVVGLTQRTDSELLFQQEILTAAFEEIQIALEELKVAEEELQQLNSELCQQNEELAATRQLVEVERQRYQDLFEEAPDAYLVTDESGTIQEANRAAAMLLNVLQKFLVGKPLDIFFSKENRQTFPDKMSQLRQVNRVQEWEASLCPRGGKPKDVVITVTTIRNQSGKVATLRWLLRDISLRKQAELQLLHNASHDALTGLPNRALFMERLGRAVEYAKRHDDYVFAVLFLDLDRFKVINDSLGHIFGDQLLIAIAGRLANCVRPTDTVARLGGDEFTILLEGIKDINDAVKVADRIQAELRLPFKLGQQEVSTTASIGIALSTTGYDRPSDLLRDADSAMYRAKSQGSACYEIFNKEMHVRAVARLQLETDLCRAVERQEFRIYYQPIVSLATGLISGFEALVRWQHPTRGLVVPMDFFPVAQETGLSVTIDRWVLASACRQIQQWQEQFPVHPPRAISVNVDRRQFAQPDLVSHVEQVLRETNLDAHSLKLEITENVIMENSSEATVQFSQLRNLGIQLYIDDFGTGYSSLSRLHHLTINGFKIDRSFVSKMGVNEGNLEIVETIMTLAQKLDVDVTAEGVETEEQLLQLKALKCKYGQGYFFSRPLNSEAAEALIVASPQW